MKRWKSILLLALVFLTGIVVGVVGTRAVVRFAWRQAEVHPERVQRIIERNLTRRLRLDERQQARLHDIMTDARGQMRALREEYRPKAGAVYQEADEKITAMLTSDQLERYQRLKLADHPLLRSLRQEPAD